ncbi:MAG: ADP-ribose pyrophosphatase [uncultured archaeon A07HN63]|nr:MAG: ADP-ribose pyrophosphatase [uncultured archaeon A07HN63]
MTDDAPGDTHNLATLSDPEWSVIESVTEYETGWFTGGYDLVEQPDGSTKRYYWAELPPAAVIVAVTDGELLFVEQYRPTIRETQYELPAGIVEPEESFTEAAARELQEEVGFAPGETELLEEFWCSTGLLRHRRGIVLATGLDEAERTLDSNEFLVPRSVPVDEALSVARSQPTNDATLEGVLLAKENGVLRR